MASERPNRRIALKKVLEDVMERTGFSKEEVYFQPPVSVKMSYPSIVYNLSNIRPVYANDKLYLGSKAYSITIIDRNPDSKIPDDILFTQPLCSFTRFFTADNLNHGVFTMYF